MRTNKGRPLSALQEGKIREMRRVANFGTEIFDPKTTGRFLSYKDVPRFRIESLYRSEIASVAAQQPPDTTKRSRPSTALPRQTKSDCNIELRPEGMDKELVISPFAIALTKNPNTNHNNTMHVSRSGASVLRQKLKPKVMNRGVAGMSITSSMTSPGRMQYKYSLSRHVLDLPSVYK